MSGKRSALGLILTTPDVKQGTVCASIHSSLLSALSDTFRPLLMAGAASAFVALMAFMRLHQWWAALWLVADMGVTAIRLGMIRVYTLRSRSGGMDARAWAASYVPLALVSALLLGAGTMACLMSGDPQLATLAVMVTAGIIGGIASRNAAIPYVAIAQILLGTLPIFPGVLLGPRLGPRNGWWILLPPLAAYVAAMISIVWRHYDELVALMIAERKHAELLARFDAALANMPHGLCTIDPSGKVVIANRRTAELFGATVDMLKLGVPLPEFIDRIWRVEADEVPSEAAREQLAGQCAGWPLKERTSLELELHHGRQLEITCNPVPDGSAVIIVEDVTERRQNEADILHLARHDALTGLLNRRGLGGQLEEMLSFPTIPNDNAPAVLYLDLDGFKQVNDELGHSAGDEVLQAVAARLKQIVRDDELVARLGGDELAIVVQRANPASATALAQRVIRELERPYPLPGGKTVTIGTSIGIAFAAGNEPAERLIERADEALYDAKLAGKGTYRFAGKTQA